MTVFDQYTVFIVAQKRLGHYLAYASSLLVMTLRDGISFIFNTRLLEKPNFGKIFLHQERLIAVLIVPTGPSSGLTATFSLMEKEKFMSL